MARIDRLENSTNEEELARQVSDLISRNTGILLGESQQHMVKLRLRQRVSVLKLAKVLAYPDYFNANSEKETRALISLLTTHHTYFFREFLHFNYLEAQGLLEVIRAVREQGRHQIRVWSAACSRGQEVYSLAMFLDFHLKILAPDMSFEILGTDIDPECIAIAQNGVYEKKELATIPLNYVGPHWARGTKEISNFYKAKRSLRNRCSFRVHNLLQGPYHHEPFDLVFCRNVFIYFAQAQVNSVTMNLLKVLAPHGRLFLGVSESVLGQSLPLRLLDSSIYTHQAEKALLPHTPPLRILCVDDSETVLTLLKHILSESAGFEVVGTAKNGLEATSQLARLEVDVITLDIHMPEQSGVEYLRRNFGPGHPPVVIISSLDREENDLALASMNYGASDYVEKPSFSNLSENAEQIRAKLRSAYGYAKARLVNPGADARNTLEPFEFDRASVIALGASTGGTEALKKILTKLPSNIPPILIVQHIPQSFSLAFAKHLAELCPFEVKEAEDGDEILPNRVLVAPGGRQMSVIRSGGHLRIAISENHSHNKFSPSVDVLFKSLAACAGADLLAGILTGMGNDGAEGLLKIKQAGGQTFVQSEPTCVVFGMPRAALSLRAAEQTVPLEDIAAYLVQRLNMKKSA